jgi:pimeloyl-ACP methyl ester carboxylesterase
VNSIYRSRGGREEIRAWCLGQLDAWAVPHRRSEVTAHGARSHVVTAGEGPTTVVLVPGTNFNAAAGLPLAGALVAAGHRVVAVDIPGQPGLSSGERPPARDGLAWYGTWLDQVVDRTGGRPVVLLGHSFGAAIALTARSPLISRLVLVSPAGLTRLRVTPRLAATAAVWALRPAPARSARLLRAMHSPGHEPREDLVTWMTLVARHARSSGAPSRATPASPVPRHVISGEHDTFLPPHRLRKAVRTALGTHLHVVPAAGHLITDEQPARLVSLAAGPEQPGPHDG